jgi:hypothetical protein
MEFRQHGIPWTPYYLALFLILGYIKIHNWKQNKSFTLSKNLFRNCKLANKSTVQYNKILKVQYPERQTATALLLYLYTYVK